MPVTVTHPFTLKDTLHSMAPGSAPDAGYAKGILVGVVGAFMAVGLSFFDAIKLASDHAPKTVAAGSVPDAWLKEFGIADAPSGVQEWVRSKGV